MRNPKTSITILTFAITAVFLILTIMTKQRFLLIVGLIVCWGLWKLLTSRKQSHKSLNKTFDAWKYSWIDKQSKCSSLPHAYWETVSDEIMAGRMEILQTVKGQNPNVPMGWYALQSDMAMYYLVQRNNKGIEREKAGDIEGAMFLYEVSIADAFFGSHPYDRLRILYTRAKQYDEAIRVCRAYLALPDRPHGQNKPHFTEWIEKLEKKRNR